MAAAVDPVPPARPSALKVGEWEVEPMLHQLATGGQVVKIEPKSMAVLVYLADRAGQVVGREELLSAVWPGVLVGDDSLTQVVIKLRKALGDVPGSPSHIQTIAKRGYRLIAPVARMDWSPGNRGLGDPPIATRSRGRRSKLIASAIGLVLLGVAVVALWMSGRPALQSLPDTAALVRAAAARAAQPSVGVRPFEALSGDPQELLLARGVTADLVTDLSKVFGVWVVGMAAADSLSQGSSPSPSAPVQYLVSGSVQRVHEHLVLHVHLSDATNGRHLWSERFDRELGGLFAIQEELGAKILRALPAKVSEAEMRRVAQRYTRNLGAYQDFLRGQVALLARQRQDNATAREMYRRAIALDPSFARAYAGLALTHAADFRNQWTDDRAAALDRAFETAQTALQIDPDIPETYWVLAFVHMERRQHGKALQLLETAVRLKPSFADGYALMAGVATYNGRPADTVPLMRIAIRLDPQAGHLHYLLLGRAYLFLGDLDQARVNLQQALARNVGNLETHVYLAVLHVMAGDMAAAAWEAEEIRALQPSFTSRGWMETYPMTDAAQKQQLDRKLRMLGF